MTLSILEHSSKVLVMISNIVKSWAACLKLRHLWKDQGLSRKIKLLLFSFTVESILFYNSATWTLTETLKKKKEHKRLLLKIVQILPWYKLERLRSKQRCLPGSRPALTKIKEHRLTFIEYYLRSDQSLPQNFTLGAKHRMKTWLRTQNGLS